MKNKFINLIVFTLLLTSCTAQKSAYKSDSTDFINNQFKFKTDIKGFGEIQFLLNFKKTSDSTFIAHSRRKASNELIGGFKTFFAKLFTKQLDNGAFIHIKNGVISNDSLRGVFMAPGITLYFSGIIKDHKIKGSLGDNKFGENKKVDFDFVGIPHDSAYIAYNYKDLTSQIIKKIKDNYFNPNLLNQRQWEKFFKKLKKLSPKAHDDFEYFIAFNNLAKKVKTSHFGILKNNPWENSSSMSNSFVEFKNIKKNTAYIKFDGFSLKDSLKIKNYFDSLVKAKTPNLVIDIRGCPGGDYSSMFLASYLVKQPREAGYFIGNKYFKTHNDLPSKKIIKSIPDFHGKSLDEFLNVIATKGLLSGRVRPDDSLHYSGNVFLLIDQNSASASEPIAYFLKQQNLAKLVGERTAGEMLSGSFVNVQDGWTLQIPTADYYTSDNYRIEGNGVKPNIKVKSDDALNYVLDKLIKQRTANSK